MHHLPIAIYRQHLCTTLCTKSHNSFRSDAFRGLLTPSSVRPVSLSILRNKSNEYQRLLIVRCKIAVFKHRRTTANIIKVPAVMRVPGETVTSYDTYGHLTQNTSYFFHQPFNAQRYKLRCTPHGYPHSPIT